MRLFVSVLLIAALVLPAWAGPEDDLKLVVAEYGKLVYEKQYLELQIRVSQERLKAIGPIMEQYKTVAVELQKQIQALKTEEDTESATEEP